MSRRGTTPHRPHTCPFPERRHAHRCLTSGGMTIDITAARRTVHLRQPPALLERHPSRGAARRCPRSNLVLGHAQDLSQPRTEGFGHALEPDVRCPGSQTDGHAASAGGAPPRPDVSGDPMIAERCRIGAPRRGPARGSADRASLPTERLSARAVDGAPQKESGCLTYALAAGLWSVGSSDPWLSRATEWCWARLERPEPIGGYTLKFAADFLDAVPDPPRAAAAVERLREGLSPDGSVPVPEGVEGETISPLDISPPSRGCLPGVVHRPAGRNRQHGRSSRRASSRTAAGRSTSCTGLPASPWSGEASPRLVRWPPCTRTDALRRPRLSSRFVDRAQLYRHAVRAMVARSSHLDEAAQPGSRPTSRRCRTR